MIAHLPARRRRQPHGLLLLLPVFLVLLAALPPSSFSRLTLGEPQISAPVSQSVQKNISVPPTVLSTLSATFPVLKDQLRSDANFVSTTRTLDGHRIAGLEPESQPPASPTGLKPQEQAAWLAMAQREQAHEPSLRPFFPSRASDPYVVEGDGVRVVLRAINSAAVTAQSEDGALAYRAMYQQTDSLHVVQAGQSEEFLLLHTPAAPTRFVYEIASVSADVQVALSDGSVRFTDAQGHGLRIAQPWVIDASGKRQTSVAHWELETLTDGVYRLTLMLNTTGLSYPLVIDPSWSVTLGFMTTARYYHTATLLPSGQVLVVGGSNGSSLASTELYDPQTGRWSATGALATAHSGHTATLLPTGQVLVVGGRSGDYLASAELYNPQTGTWSVTGALATARSFHTATLLPTGQVLVVGGFNGDYLASAELYNPQTGTWNATGPLATARNGHTTTLLPTGQVLVVGGFNSGVGSLASAELYNPQMGTWSATGPLATPRSGHTATLLPTGQVLVVGGAFSSGNNNLASAELYDPHTGTWSATGALTTPRSEHTATLLPSGQVLVVGGFNDGSLQNAELYDSQTGAWSAAGTLATPRNQHSATLLPSGQVLIVGGFNDSILNAELYDSQTGTWSSTGALTTPRSGHTATLLPTGQVLVVGGSNGSSLASTELYDPQTGTWSATGVLATPRIGHTATLLPTGQVLVVGGSNSGNYTATTELYNPQTGIWSATAALATPRIGHTATLLPTGQVLIVGGFTSGNYVASAELYDPKTDTWSSTGALATPRSGHTATLLLTGQLLVVGGSSRTRRDEASAELYDPKTGTWSSTGALATPRNQYTATLLPSGHVLVVGGSHGNNNLASAELYDPQTGDWSATGTLITPRSRHTATLLPTGQVLVVGGSNANNYLASAELYDPQTGRWSATAALATARSSHTATLLPNGQVLVVGGYNNGILASAEVYDTGLGFQPSSQPVLATVSEPLAVGKITSITGSGFAGILSGHAEGSGGTTQSSATNYPLLQLRSLTNDQTVWLPWDPAVGWSDTSFTSLPLPAFTGGYALATIVTNGIASASKITYVNFPPSISALTAQTASAGAAATLGPLPFTINDAETPASQLILSARSSDPALIRPEGITFSGAGNARTLTLTPQAYQSGSATVTINVSDGLNTTSTSFTLTVLPPAPAWLVMLYLAGDDVPPPDSQGRRTSLSEPINRLVGQLGAMPYNPNMRLVVLADGNGVGDSHVYVRQPNGLQDVTSPAPWAGFPINNELDTGSVSTLRNFVTWARSTFPGSRYSMLSIVDHGGGWGPDFGDVGQRRTSRIIQTGGWRGMSFDHNSDSSLSTRNTAQALEGLGHFDVVFFDACLMGMIESADEIQPYTSYLVAGENLLWADLPYDRYLDKAILTATTTPPQLATNIVEHYNEPAPASEPFTLAAVDMSKLPDLVTKTNTLAQHMISALGGSDASAAERSIRRAYEGAQKFDYDGSLTLDQQKDGYVDLADFARQLQRPEVFISNDILADALAISEAIGGRGEANRVVLDKPKSVSGIVNSEGISSTWDFSHAYGLSIYLPLGERDCRPTGQIITTMTDLVVGLCQPTPDSVLGNPIIEPQLQYYTRPEQLAFTRNAPSWAALLNQLDGHTPARDPSRPPFQSPFPLQNTWRAYLPLVGKAAPRDIGTDLVVTDIQVIPTTPASGQAIEVRVTIQNRGSRDVVTPFWVDLYADPSELPRTNEIWPQLSQYGAAWRVYTLAAGESLTLSTLHPNDPQNPGKRYSNLTTFVGGGSHQLYALVDSYADAQPDGALGEDQEDNNLYGPQEVVVTGQNDPVNVQPAIVLNERTGR